MEAEGRGSPDDRDDRLLDSPSSREQVEDQHDDGEHQEDMDPRAYRVYAHYSEQPKDEQNDCDCPKHYFFSWETVPGNLFCHGREIPAAGRLVVSCGVSG